MIRRLKVNALTELPPKTRQAIPVVMGPQQAAMYKELEENMILDFKNYMDIPPDVRDMVTAQNQMVNVLRLRQFLVTPRLLGIDIDGAAMEVLGEMVEDELISADRVIIFTPFAEAIPFITEHITKHIKGVQCLYVHGGMNPRHLDDQVQQFQASDNVKKVIICTIKSGASITLHAASTEFFLGCEWSLGDNEQAEDRAHRQGQAENVVCYYLLHKGAMSDDRILEVLGNKTWAVNWCLSPEMMLERSK
jgi:SWI/SNF-related matrix-associated actin-dependent regulator 1 of chromatin subfamily A